MHYFREMVSLSIKLFIASYPVSQDMICAQCCCSNYDKGLCCWLWGKVQDWQRTFLAKASKIHLLINICGTLKTENAAYVPKYFSNAKVARIYSFWHHNDLVCQFLINSIYKIKNKTERYWILSSEEDSSSPVCGVFPFLPLRGLKSRRLLSQ